MVKLSIVTGGITIVLDIENIDMEIKEFKTLIEGKMPENKKIPCDKQILYVKQKKLEDSGKLSDYIKEEDDGVRIFVLKDTKSAFSKPEQKVSNPYVAPQQQPQNSYGAPSNNPYGTPSNNPYTQPMYGMQQPMYGYQQPMPSPHGYQQPMPSPHSYQPMYGYQPHGMQQPYGMQQPMNVPISKEYIDMIMGNPGMIDSVIELQNPGMAPEEKNRMKKLYMDAFKMLQNNPGMINAVTQSMQTPVQPQYNQQYPNMYNQYQMPPVYPSPYTQSPQLSRDEYKNKYMNELTALKEMGFHDDEQNLTVLIQSNGDINHALDMLRKDGSK